MEPRRRTRPLPLTACAAAVLATTAAAAAPPATARPPAPGPSSLRVATYNIHAGAGADGVFDPERQAAALRRLHADVIGLQEVDDHWGARSHCQDLAARLGRRLGMHVFFAPIYDEAPATEGGPRRRFGVALLSRLPFAGTWNHRLTRLSTQDPDPRPAPAPGFAEVVVRVHGVPVHVYDTHLDYRHDPSVRATQVAETRRVLARDRDAKGRRPPQVLLGDLNAEPGAPELAPLWRDLTRADAGAASWPADVPTGHIDYVTGSRHTVAFRHARVVAGLASDHRPLVADAVLRTGAASG